MPAHAHQRHRSPAKRATWLTRRAFSTALPLSMLQGAARATTKQATPGATPIATPAMNGPTLHVTPTEVRFDERFDVWVTGLRPAQDVTITARFQSGSWTSEATYEAASAPNGETFVDMAAHVPVAGAFDVADTMGLIWAARGSGVYHYEITGPEMITITATTGDRVIGEETIERTILPADRAPEYIYRDDMAANYYAPASSEDGLVPAVIVLGGSEGAIGSYVDLIAALLASRGYAVLALAYFGMGPLPPGLSRIPLEYFGNAIAWLQGQDGVDPDRIGIAGVSRGAELALLAGSTYPEIKAVVSCVGTGYAHAEYVGPGSDLAVSAWTWQGEDIPHLTSFDMTEAELRAAEIPVERINGPVLMIGADADRVWPSSYLSGVAWARLKREGHPWPDQLLRYPGAGHAISMPPYQPVRPLVSPDFGGDPLSNATAMANAWPAVCHMLDARLTFGS